MTEILTILSLAFFVVIGFAAGSDDDGGGGDGDDKNKNQTDDGGNGDDDDDDEPGEDDQKIKDIQKDPDAVKKLLEAKRKANAEAKKHRIEAEKLQKEKQKAEDEKLKEEKKFQELAEKKEQELEDSKVKFIRQAKLSALKAEALKKEHGIVDVDLVNLINLDEVEIDENYVVTNAPDVIEDFKEKKPDFFKKEDGDDKTPPEGDKKPGIREKVLGTGKETEKPGQGITSYFKKKAK